MYLTNPHQGTSEEDGESMPFEATADYRPLSGDESDRLAREPTRVGEVAYRREGLTPHVLAESLNESIKAHRDGRHGPS